MQELYDIKNNNDYQILWSRGKEVLNFPISQKLAERVSKSEKDALEVMFYCEIIVGQRQMS